LSILGIDEQKIGGAPALRLTGQLDHDTAPALRKILLKYVDHEGQRLIADLEGVEYMDTTGLATLLEAHARLRKHGGRIVLFGLAEQVHDLFVMNQVDRLFSIVDDEAAAAEQVQ
jgi:anti-sigma B factor antagonist